MTIIPSKLDYSNLPPIWCRQKPVRWTLICVVTLAVSYLVYKGWITWEEPVRFTYWKFCCEHYSAPAEMPVFSTDPTIVRRMLARGSQYQSFRSDKSDAYLIPNELTHLRDMFEIRKSLLPDYYFEPEPASGTIFLHEWTPPQKDSRLVNVRVYVDPSNRDDAHWVEIFPRALILVELWYGKKWTPIDILWSDRLTLFSGQPDPHDKSRFTIGYSFNGEGGTIEGLLQDKNDDDVVFSVGDGPLRVFDDGSIRRRDGKDLSR